MSAREIKWRHVRYHWEIYFFILPALAMIVLFQYVPAASGIWHSFYRWNGGDISEYVGLRNYIDLVESSDFWMSFRVALIIGAWNVVKMVPAVAVAVWIHRCSSERLQFIYRLLFVVPMVLPGLVVAMIWRSFFFESTQGYLNQFLNASGLMLVLGQLDSFFHWGGIFTPGGHPAWLGDPRLIISACVIWGFPWVGSFAVLTHLAKLQNIPKEIYEAASIDGAGWWTKFTQIEAPLILSSIYLMLVFVIIGSMKDAGMIIALTGNMYGGPGGLASVPALFMLRKAFINQEMGAACATGVVLTIVVMALQKLSTVVLDDNARGRRWRRIASPVSLLGGFAVFLAPGGWPELGLLLIFCGLPYASISSGIGGILRRLRALLVPAVSANVGLVAGGWEPRRVRTTGPIESWSLRVFRHAAIWAVLLSSLIPVYLMLVVSVKSNHQFYLSPGSITFPLQWQNWPDAWNVIGSSVANSIYLSTVSTVLTLALALAGAYFFARLHVPFSGFLWNALLILLMMPSVANLVPLFRLLANLSLLNTFSALILVGASGGQIFCIFVLRNFMEEIPFDLFEAAEIDGANHFQQMRIIVLPLVGPIFGTLAVMQFVNEWNEFVLPLIVMQDSSNLPVMVQMQRLSGEYVKYFGPLMAGYALSSIPIIVLFAFSMRLFVRGMTEGGTKG